MPRCPWTTIESTSMTPVVGLLAATPSVLPSRCAYIAAASWDEGCSSAVVTLLSPGTCSATARTISNIAPEGVSDAYTAPPRAFSSRRRSSMPWVWTRFNPAATCDFVYRGAGVGTDTVAPRSRSSRLRRHGF